ncbi:MAG: aminotransferase class I/II-fold pyridoxal phosphate-dependent enzyme, partial [Calditrichales bacterium]
DDVFGEDPTVNDLQIMVAELLGKDQALFVPSGTQANQIAIAVHTHPGDEVICDYNSHIFNYECGAPAMLSGVQLHPVHGVHGQPDITQLSAAIREKDDEHLPNSALICLENTHNRAGGTVFPLSEIRKINSLAKKNDLKMHLDGARLWNAAVQTGVSLKDFAQYFDSISLCFSKGLGAPVGSIVVGTSDFIKRAHQYRKALGGGMRQVGIIAAACIFAVENHFERLADDHRNARILAEALNQLETFHVDMSTVQTNIVIADIEPRIGTAVQIAGQLTNAGILSIPFGPQKIRFVTHLNVNKDDIDITISNLSQIFK